ncbi:MAG: cobyrinic acid a,c-diamide synthase [Armatimonadetes bacterium CG_4_10_14_3_um_filter_66_18]|nr:cobyrinate a,c-diamide synthase [Armatimonadota bacterium]OIP09156.1 MAG: cobyrinic acid a,c-diamide synthase [Armatimonadetes bacterium CG2_30_66_41]PIW13455.1 MAG: cobyrinic acid a,c-diamide synthase [Armatimonadetes bacterium CG17_big_fil_post_rev_8_21_14_2_50_66_6]PIX40393.1 MAG: cobyrinic acid a,c-diamide synthase [Armatimonadetes bacterium CG_4_8_14_3_um_filter_66_20]PIY37871.1 MAG: cobyrinic acid a,c-diamide synthase [Armatimonadetes bacterium CG_4_10_14_3_um_filter_66_18]PIZ33860.1 
MKKLPPRIVVSALRGSAGKTTVALGVAAALRERGVRVAPFKKGPDYIDPAWLTLAAGAPCRNLDTFMLPRDRVQRWFAECTDPDQLAVIEGNRGLYDGLDSAGTHSTAELAKLLAAPVVLVLDCTKVSRTAAAMILGCQQLDPACQIRGVVLNQVAQARHESSLRECVKSVCDLPVLGALPKLRHSRTKERHLGLVPPQEHTAVEAVLADAKELAEQYLDLDGLHKLAQQAPATSVADWEAPPPRARFDGVRVGVLRDSVFQFYYPENLEAFRELGAEVIELNSLTAAELPPLEALYLGGGFPETQAAALAANAGFRESVREAVEGGLPVFAECGGLMYLGRELRLGDESFPMVGALPVAFELNARPQGHGYTVLASRQPSPYFPVGRVLTGHEFHYSRPVVLDDAKLAFAFSVQRGTGFGGQSDGLLYRNVLATYTHFHALGVDDWAETLLRQAVLT